MNPIEAAATRRRAMIAGADVPEDYEEARRQSCFDAAILANAFLQEHPEIGTPATVPMFREVESAS